MDIVDLNTRANFWTAANNISTYRVILGTRCPFEVIHLNVADCQIRRILVAECQVILTVALRDFDSIIDIGNLVILISDVLDVPETAAAL